MAKFLSPYKAGVDTLMQVVIGRTDIPLSKAQPESLLGNFVADAQLAAAKKKDSRVVASVANYGGIRLSYIAPGPITRRTLYELMPFENLITIVEVPGAVVKQFCDHMAKAKGWPVSGISYTLKDQKAEDVMINGTAVNDHILYKIAVSDYIANGGDHCDFLADLNKKPTTILVRDALVDYVAQSEMQNKPLHPVLEKRVRYAE
jgi:2',3'-cyclic-nucleotide 2'-phosphodiesterase (5'-nucleotidase family)